MLDSSYLKRRAAELGLGREDQLQQVQTWLDLNYPAQARCRSLHQGVLKIATPVSTVASDLRMRQSEIKALLSQEDLTRVQIVVGSIGD